MLGNTGATAATPIDLTSDEENYEVPLPDLRPPVLAQQHMRPLPSLSLRLARSSTLLSRHSYNAQVQFKRKPNSKIPGPDLQIITGGHANLTFWKDKYYRELAIEAEHRLAIRSIQDFDKRSITTVVPNRYLRPPKNGGCVEFPGAVEVLPPVRAVRQAYEEQTSAKQDTARLVLWTDGSASAQHRGFAVVWRLSTTTGWGRWEAAGYKAIGEVLDAVGMESLAVIKALDKAHEISLQSATRFRAIAVYTDAQSALCNAQRPAGSLGQHMVKKARQLRQLGAEISLHWCPGHSKVPGNELADKIANIASHHVYENMAEVVDLSDDEEGV